MIYLRNSLRILVMIKLAKTIIPRTTASIISTLCIKTEMGFEAPKRMYADKLNIPVPNIMICYGQESVFYHIIGLNQIVPCFFEDLAVYSYYERGFRDSFFAYISFLSFRNRFCPKSKFGNS